MQSDIKKQECYGISLENDCNKVCFCRKNVLWLALHNNNAKSSNAVFFE